MQDDEAVGRARGSRRGPLHYRPMDRTPPGPVPPPPPLTPLLRAYRLQEQAAGLGFDWPDARGPLVKVREELSELAAALPAQGDDRPAARAALEDEVGDLLFAVVNWPASSPWTPTPRSHAPPRSFAGASRRWSGWPRNAAWTSPERGSTRSTGCGTR